MKFFAIICFAGFIISCGQQEEENNLIQEEQVVLSPSEDFHFEDFVDDVTYIKLENTPKSIFSYANKLIFRGKKIYILDRTGEHHVYVFSSKGDFMAKVGRIGRGPREYLRLRDFDVDMDGNIYLYDRQNMKMISYDSTNSFLKKESTEGIRADGFKKLSNGKFLFSVSKENPKGSLNDFHLILTDENYKELKRMLPMDPDFRDNYLAMNIVQENSSNIYYNKPIDGRVYLLTNDGSKIKKCLKLDFENPLPKKFVNDFQLLSNHQENISADYLISPPVITENYIFGTGEHTTNETRFFFVYEKGSNKTFSIDIVPENYTHRNINFPLMTLGDSAVVTLLEPSMVAYDGKKSDLSADLAAHLANNGFVLVIHYLKKNKFQNGVLGNRF